MTDIIVKDIKNGSEYYYGGSAEVSAEDVSYDNSSSGATADNVQDALDELKHKQDTSGGTVIERGDMLLGNIYQASAYEGFFISKDSAATNVKTLSGVVKTSFVRTTSYTPKSYINNDGILVYYSPYSGAGGGNTNFYKVNLQTNEVENVAGGNLHLEDIKIYNNGCYIYSSNTGYKKIDLDLVITDSTEEEYNAIPSGLYYKGLYYSQDGNDYVAVDGSGVEVKRYSGVSTIDGIYNDKLYRNVGNVAYAIATI